MPLRIAHRGMPRRIRENTLPSFALAIASGAEGIELDAHATCDGVVVVHHDAELAGGAPIAELTHAELAGHEAAPGISIPTLRDVCALVDGRVTLFVELKGVAIESRVVAALAGYAGAAAIHSFDHAMIARLHAAGCRYPLGILFDDRIADVAEAMARTGATDVWPHFSLVTRKLVDEVHALGGRVIPWTVNDPVVARDLAREGVDGLCGDDVTLLAPA